MRDLCFRCRRWYRSRHPVSATIKLPPGSSVKPEGAFSSAAMAGPPSPEKPAVPFPATVVITPAVSIFRMRELPESEMKILPWASTAIPEGALTCAALAGPLSPENPGVPLPAIIAME